MLRVSWDETGHTALDRLGRQLISVAKLARGGSYARRHTKFKMYLKFLGFLAESFSPEDIRNIQPRHVAAFIKHLREQGRSDKTILEYLSVVRWWHKKIPWHKYELPENKALFELEAKLDDKRFCEEIKNKSRRKKVQRCLQKPGSTI